MKLEKIDAFLFDLGGTLYRKPMDLGDIARQFLGEIGLSEYSQYSDDELTTVRMKRADRWLDEYMLDNNVDIHWAPPRDIWIEYDKIFLIDLGAKGDIDYLAREYQHRWDNLPPGFHSQLLDGVTEALEELHSRGYKLGIASNRFIDPLPRLKKDSILHLFDAIEWTNVPGYRKPAPYLLIKAVATLGLNPTRCAYVGNMTEFDAPAAKNAGMIPILITWCYTPKNPIPSDTIIIEHINELLEIIP
jgi:phosphoglycolate phosphatase-like HAD superfamily hydrolase